MVLDLIITLTDDGFTAEVPSVSGCESWAHTEEEVISNALILLRFYLSLPDEADVKIDKARRNKNKIVYKLIFEK